MWDLDLGMFGVCCGFSVRLWFWSFVWLMKMVAFDLVCADLA